MGLSPELVTMGDMLLVPYPAIWGLRVGIPVKLS